MSLSMADRLARLPKADRDQWVRSLNLDQRVEIARLPWWFVRRPEQKCPTGFDWLIWLILSGRGWGKSRTGAETLMEWVCAEPTYQGIPTEWAVIGETKGDTREICVRGPSGLLRVFARYGWKEDRDFTYNKTDGLITLLPSSRDVRCQGQRIHLLGADDADVGRGLNLSGAWLDEFAKWPYPVDSWFQGILPALRIGKHPRCVVTTTPKPLPILREWVRDPATVVTRGSTFDNAINLSKKALGELERRYKGTRVGRQELQGELLDDIEGALWTRAQIDADRVWTRQVELYRTVIAVDPAVTSGENADETGIIVAGRGVDDRGYILADRSIRTTPLQWAQRVVAAFDEFEANEVIIEVNNGGEALADLLHTVRPGLPVTMISAKKAKRVRAEPVSALYEQHRISHVGEMKTLEDQLCEWTPELNESPDRMDALVYAVLGLFETGDALAYLQALTNDCPACGLPMPNGYCIRGH